jgi:hypothetical protein
MRAKFHGMLVICGLLAATLAKAGQAELPPTPLPGIELVIDTRLDPAELHFNMPTRPDSIWNLPDVSAFGPPDFTELDLALSSPDLLFGRSHDFLSIFLHFGSGPTTAVAFPNYSR